MLEVVNLSPACFHLLRTEVISSVGPFDAPVSWFRISPASEERPAIVRKRGLAHTGAGLVEEAGRLLQVHVFAMQPFVPHCQPRLRHHEARWRSKQYRSQRWPGRGHRRPAYGRRSTSPWPSLRGPDCDHLLDGRVANIEDHEAGQFQLRQLGGP